MGYQLWVAYLYTTQYCEFFIFLYCIVIFKQQASIDVNLISFQGGSISRLLSRFGPFQNTVILKYTRQILMALAYLHDCGCLHRDIKGKLLSCKVIFVSFIIGKISTRIFESITKWLNWLTNIALFLSNKVWKCISFNALHSKY